MTTLEQARSTAAPPPAGRRGRVLGWTGLGVLVLVIAFIAGQIAAQLPERHPALDPVSHLDNGTLALAQLLRAQGIEVEVARTHTQAIAAVRAESTLVFAHPPALSDEAVTALARAADHTVVITVSARILRLLDLGEDALTPADRVGPGCDWLPFSRIGEIAPTRLFAPAPGVTGCFADAEGNAAVLLDRREGRTLALVHAPTLLANEFLAEDGNAALGLALLGQTGHVVWYVPSIADTDLEWQRPETIGTLTPGWVTPAILALLIGGLAAALWRGRRFGPLVAETLPVTVRASETMQGRAHLTARAGDAAHAAEALRTGAVRRLARRLGLSERATSAQVADAAADRLRAPRSTLQEMLTSTLPASDPELIDFARSLDELERAIEASTHTERSTP